MGLIVLSTWIFLPKWLFNLYESFYQHDCLIFMNLFTTMIVCSIRIVYMLWLVIISESFICFDYLIFMNRLLTLNILKLKTHSKSMISYRRWFSYWFWLFSRYESFCIVEYFSLTTHSKVVNSFLIRFFSLYDQLPIMNHLSYPIGIFIVITTSFLIIIICNCNYSLKSKEGVHLHPHILLFNLIITHQMFKLCFSLII